jgi:FkbM family methyltransferase
MRRLSDRGILNTVGKKVTPLLGRAVNGMGATGIVEFAASYLSLLTGKGSGTGWDDGEEIAAANLLRGIRDPIIIDCGANQGEWTRRVRHHLGSDGGHWILIEPATECLKMLNELPNVEVINAAVGEAPAVMALYSDDGTSAIASLHLRGDSFLKGRQFTTRDVSVIALDSVIQNLDRVDFMKMDIEGHELFALKGALRSLETRKVKALSFEFGGGNINSRTYFRDFWDFLKPLGFELRRICPGGSTVRIREYYEDLEAFRGVSNYIATLGVSRSEAR